MRAFLQQFAGCLQLLRDLPPPSPAVAAAAAAAGGGDAVMAEASGASSGGASSALADVDAYRASVEGTVGTFLVLMTNMRWVCRVGGGQQAWGLG